MGNNKFRMYENLAFLTYIGIMMVTPIFGGVVIGKFLDDKFGTGNVFLFIFVIIGVLSSFTSLYKITMKMNKRK
ncbi:Putative F0F1-ATPase subunit Ca2+/Mg2+ transporter [Caminicella sporogenes DSM 14501]|uniref:Putative F0F1-ATPase subunit Ca2+/Mg2+ transporter n=1 Tax=Caminicella sporogenes DSM 14501 TaxID=1121266 RepID=A0A1M6PTJ9_9FIRM|nr:AtpZ/AtpI family protein [Caminicella sporogenes]WIF96057.1 AtpZ/AtpI family protein [Caminicella sporogenes]SHK11241.1 Putative F0F1-ATPase subunit Ca2+/Mg2+ transporter [Caminicella sporogenes DSM 14501]